MRIPTEKEQDGFARLELYRETIQACFYSEKKRRQQYEVLKHYYVHGCSPEVDEAPFNKIEPLIDTLSAFLYSADSTRFSAHLGPEVPAQEWDKVQPIGKAVNIEWMNSGSDQMFSQALDWSLVYQSMFVKIVMNGGHPIPYLVEPACLGVYREDVNGLDRQEAIALKYTITKTELEAMLTSHPSRQTILDSLAAKPIRPRDEMPEGLRRIIVTNLAGVPPLSPGNQVTGNGTLTMAERIDYTPGIAADVIEMTELWIKDDDIDGKGRTDWRTVTIAEENTVIYDRPNIFVQGEQPFTQVCPMPMVGYFWGFSFAGGLIGLQGWRNVRVSEIQRIEARQANPPIAAMGFSGMADETVFALQQPGGVMNNSDPMGKVQRFDEPVPADLWDSLDRIDAMFLERAGLSPLLMGRGETGVRSGRQTTELSRLGSSRTKKRALCVEDNLETLATKMFKAMRRYDDNAYLTVPSQPGAKPVKFILNQAPDDAIIKVDAHSNSPLFVEDQKTLAADLLEAHAIDRESYIDMLNPPMKEVLLKKLPAIEAKEQAAAKSAAEHETQMAMAKHSPPGPMNGAGARQ